MKDTYTPEHHISLYNVKTEYLQSILQIKSTFRNNIEVYIKNEFKEIIVEPVFLVFLRNKLKNKNVSGEMFIVILSTRNFTSSN